MMNHRYQEDILFANAHYTDPALTFELAGITHPDANYRITRICSPCTVIEYVRKGRGWIRYGGRSYPVSAGDFYILGHGIDHYYGADEDDPYEKIWVNVSGTLVYQLRGAYRLSHSLELFPAPVEKALQAVHSALTQNQPMPRLHEAGALALHRLLIDAARSRTKMTEPSLPEIIRQALDQRVYQRVFLEEVAGQLGISRTHMIRVFREHFGMTPYQYLLMNKVRLARSLLISTSLPVRAISRQLAFADESYFIRIFRAQTGLTPGDYRRCGGLEEADPIGQDSPPSDGAV